MKRCQTHFSPIAVILLLAGCGPEPRKSEAPKAPPFKLDRAPDVFRAKFETTKGPFVVEVHRDWAPRGADRFYELVAGGFYNGTRFYRVKPNFVVQWGISGDPTVSQLWANLRILDDPVKQSNKKGTLAFAAGGPASRTTQVFINLADNSKSLDKSGFAVFGRVVEGMEDVVERLYWGYGEMAPRGSGPDPTQIERKGNAYLDERFPRLDRIRKASVLP